MKRREFLEKMGIVTGAVIVAPGIALSQADTTSDRVDETLIPTSNVEWAGLQKVEPMARGFQKFPIKAKINGTNEVVGDFFVMEEGSKMEIVTNDLHPEYFGSEEIDFDAIAQDQTTPGMIMAGSYTHDWKEANDMVYAYGEAAGLQEVEGYNGLVVMKEDGVPQILHRDDLSSDVKTFSKKVESEGWSQFQQIMVIRDGKRIHTPGSQSKFAWRFLVERESNGSTVKGVISMSKKMKVDDAIAVMEELTREEYDSRIKNAVLLDAGAVEEAYYFDENGNDQPMITSNMRTNQKSLFTNALVFSS